MKRLHKLALAAAALEALGAAYSFVVLPRLRRWGATPDEASRALPGDDLIPDPLYATTRAITVQAPAEAVFPWLVQLGQNRGGFYTYDALENLFRLDIHSADRIHPEWQDLEPGSDYVSLDPEHTMKLTIVAAGPAARVRHPHRRPGRGAAGARRLLQGRDRGHLGVRRGAAVRDVVAAPHPLARELAGDRPRRVRARLPARARPLRHGRGHAARRPPPRGARRRA